MTEVHLGEAQLKRKAIESSQQVIALIDSSKFGKEDLTSFASPEKVTRLFTDEGISSYWIEQIQQKGIQLIICKEEMMFAK
jgi:DeoR/GlpR family transcriptional regulator of sugar metabolism